MKKDKRNDLYGILMRPCSMTLKENEEVMRSTDYFVDSSFKDVYEKHIGIMEIVAESAKIFVINNWEKVQNWKDLNIIITSKASGENIEFYNYVPREIKPNGKTSKTWSEIRSKMDQRNKKKHNPIETMTDMVLDPTDGDFSLTVNGKEFWWITDDTIIVLADYVEKQLKIEK